MSAHGVEFFANWIQKNVPTGLAPDDTLDDLAENDESLRESIGDLSTLAPMRPTSAPMFSRPTPMRAILDEHHPQ